MCPASFIRRINKLLCTWMLASVILSRSFNTTLIQSTCHINQTHLGNSHIKYLPNNCCRLWISNQFMLIFRILHQAIWHMTTKIFSLLHLLVLCSLNLHRQILAVIIINNILHDHIKSTSCPFVIVTVIMVIDGNEPHTHKRKDSFQIISQFDIIPAKSREVLYNNTVNLTLFYFLQQSLKGRPFEISARITIIKKLILH